MTEPPPRERWLAALAPFGHDQMPAAPARVLEIGCGSLGGFVPSLRAAGHDAVGVDPEAPAGGAYRRLRFEEYDVQQPVDVVVACTSLHHVADLGLVLDRAAAALVPGGAIVVIEWAHERFDEATARWCFDRLTAAGDEEGWLHDHQAEWETSGRSWNSYLEDWADSEGLHTGDDIIGALGRRFANRILARAPYLFSDLDNITEADEQAAIDADQIRSTGIRYVGQRD